MTAVPWLVFDPRNRDDAEVVLLSDDMAGEIRRLAYGRQVAFGTETVHFLVNGNPGRQYVRLAPSTDRGRAERDAQLGPDLVARFVTPPRAPSPVVVRLRQLAAALDGLELPAHESADLYLTFEEVDPLVGVGFAGALIERLPGAYLETSQLSVAVRTRYGDVDACIELVRPEAPAAPANTTELAELGAS